MFIQDTLERGDGTAVASGDAGMGFCITEDTADHFMGNGRRKEYDQIRRTDILQAFCHFWIYFCLALILSAQFLILSGHTFISAYDHYAHEGISFSLKLAHANRFDL